MAKDNQPTTDGRLAAIEPFTGAPTQVAIPPQGQAMQQMKTEYHTAVRVQQPRSLETITKNVLHEAHLAGSGFYYRWEVKTKSGPQIVQGGSIDLAMSLARNFGNCAVDIQVDESESHYLFTSMFVDIESGFQVKRLFRQRKRQNIGAGMSGERQDDIVFQIGQSKCTRNTILRSVPAWLVNMAIDEARKAEVGKVNADNIVEARGRLLAWFAQRGVTEAQLEAYCGCKVNQITAETIADLRGMATGVEEGRVDLRELFPPIDDEPKPAEQPAKKAAAKSKAPAKGKPPAKKQAPGHRYPDQTPDEVKIQQLSEELSAKINGLATGQDDRLGLHRYCDHMINVVGAKPIGFYTMAIDAFEQFCATGRAWVAQQVREATTVDPDQGDEQPPPETTGGDPLADEGAWMAEWINLRGGFRDYVLDNIELFQRCSQATQKKARAKWQRIKTITDPWPLDTPQDKPSTTKAGNPLPQTETPQNEGNDEPVVDVFETPQWAECVGLYEKHPEIYTAVRSELDISNSDLTPESLQQIIDAIKQRAGEQDQKF